VKKEYFETLLEDVKERLAPVMEGHESFRHEIKDMHRAMNETFEMVDDFIENSEFMNVIYKPVHT
jgi:hypothetical protein